MITLKQLRYFSALARHRHFGQAAGECAVTQPALSMQIRELETDLGVDLVERRPGEVALTPVGIEVARRAEQVLAGVRALVETARHRGRPMAGPLRLGLIPTLAPYVLPKVLPAVQSRYPELRLELRETQTAVLLDELARGLIDAAMLALPVEAADVETTVLFEDPFFLAVPADDPRSPAAPVDPAELERERLLLLEEGHCLRDQALAICSAAGCDPLSRGAASLTTVVQLVAGGYGATLLPQIAAAIEARNPRIRLLRFKPPEPGRTIGLAFRRSSPRRSEFAAIAALVRDALGFPAQPPDSPAVQKGRRPGMQPRSRGTRKEPGRLGCSGAVTR